MKRFLKSRSFFMQASILGAVTAVLVLLPAASTFPARATTPSTKASANCSSAPAGSQPRSQFRAVWIATVLNIDWPGKTGLSADLQQQQFIAILDKVQQMHMNAVVVQVRPTADAFYPSKFFPWSRYLMGVQGQDPGYDPLAFMIKEAHQRNIQFHAWFNPYRVSMSTDLTQLTPDNPALLHPDWVVSYDGKLYFNPGIPAVRQYVMDGIMEVVKNYDIDGVHFDDYFYPYPVAGRNFPDQASYRQYGANFSRIGDWRRDNVNQLVHGLSLAIKQAKPYVQFGISPFGVWRNASNDPTGSATHANAQNFDDLYADTRLWIKKGWLDYIVPQIYWNIGFPAAAYDILVSWWSHEVASTNVQLFIGMAAYRLGTTGAWLNPNELPKQLALNLRYPQVQGALYFGLGQLTANQLGFADKLSKKIYKRPALVPVIPNPQGKKLNRVVLLPATRNSQGNTLNWLDHNQEPATSYAIYRFSGREHHDVCDFNDPQSLLATVRHTEGVSQTFVDTIAQSGQTYTYYVTAIDRYNRESAPSDGQTVEGA